jgi:hypothetical protein
MRRTQVQLKKRLIWRNTIGIELMLDHERKFLFLRQGYGGCMPHPTDIMWGLIDQNLRSVYCFELQKVFAHKGVIRAVQSCDRIVEAKYCDFDGGISAKY